MILCSEMSQTTSWNPESYAKNARFVSDLGEPLLQLLEPQPGELILDLGCGDGALTEKITGYGCEVIGVDASFLQLQATKERGLKVAVMDGHSLGFKRRFDAVFTNAALHWMNSPKRLLPASQVLSNLGDVLSESLVARVTWKQSARLFTLDYAEAASTLRRLTRGITLPRKNIWNSFQTRASLSIISS
jgi:trans-aconitate methyltransferase